MTPVRPGTTRALRNVSQDVPAYRGTFSWKNRYITCLPAIALLTRQGMAELTEPWGLQSGGVAGHGHGWWDNAESWSDNDRRSWVPSDDPRCQQFRPAPDSSWLLGNCFKIIMMQAGFAVVESSFVRKKNSANIMMKKYVNTLAHSLSNLADRNVFLDQHTDPRAVFAAEQRRRHLRGRTRLLGLWVGDSVRRRSEGSHKRQWICRHGRVAHDPGPTCTMQS